MARSHRAVAPPAGQHPQWRPGADYEQPAPSQPAYPHLPPFVQSAAAAHANGAGHGGSYGQPPHQGRQGYAPNPYAAPANHQGYGAPADLRGSTYDWQPQPDPLNYDLGNYQPTPVHQFNGPRPAGYDEGGQWAPGSAAPEPYAFANPANNLPAESGHYADEDADYEPEEPRRRGRRWLVLSVLVGSIGVGGGMAYSYKTFIAPKSGERAPVVRASKEPLRVLPDTSSAKRSAGAEGRLGSRLESSAGSDGELDANGVRRVSTVPIGRDGSVGPPAGGAQSPVQGGPPRQTVGVPGMVVDGLAPRVAAVQPPIAPQSVPVAPVARNPAPVTAPQPAAPQRAQVIARASPQAAEPPAAAAPRAAVKAAAPKQAVPKAGESTGSIGANGYVAVLSTQKSRMDALKNFADMQQKYGSVLQDKIPDVIEADLSARGLGTMYRVVVGPPGSRDAASGVCGQLKTAGYQGCWITAY